MFNSVDQKADAQAHVTFKKQTFYKENLFLKKKNKKKKTKTHQWREAEQFRII